MIYSSEDMQTRAVLDTAARMCAAARTAPKTRGMDGLVTCVVTGEDKDRLAAHMRELAGRLDYAFFARDADNVDYADAVVLFGMEEQRRGLNAGCQYCHFADCADCAEKEWPLRVGRYGRRHRHRFVCRRGGRRPGRQPRDVLRRPCRPEPRSARRLRHARPRHSPQRQRKVPVL